MLNYYRNNSTLKLRIVTLLFLAAGVNILTSCQSEQDKKSLATMEEQIPEPVDRDLDDIKRSGVLKMITRYTSNSYFLHRGVEKGFEYELVREFAKENDLALEVLVLQPGENPYELLNKGEGDLIAANLAVNPNRRKHVQFTRPYNLVDQVVGYSQEHKELPDDLEALEKVEISVRRGSSYHFRLNQLKDQGFDIDLNVLSEEWDTEALFYGILDDKFEATVSDENIFKAASKYMPDLKQGPTIAKNDTIAWAIRDNAKDLEAKMNKFLFKHFRFRRPGLPPKRSAFLNILRQRYFTSSESLSRYYTPEENMRGEGILSPYDELVQKLSNENNMDWKLVTSIIAQESKFNPKAESWAGAVGLMQILPRFSEVPTKEALFDPETNIREGIRILKEHLDHYTYMDSTNQWKFALASYNAGQGHLADARRLAIDQNRNPNEWENVERTVLLLMQRKYYKNARYGFCRGIETVRYVREIMNRYDTYETIVALAERQKEGNVPGILGIQTIN